MKELSLVIPIMNEEENVSHLIEAVRGALNGIDYELVLVDDGSTDNTRGIIKQMMDDRTALVELKKNYGQSSAMSAGIDYATGEYIAMMDGDLQNDPSDIPAMLEKLKSEDWDIVAGNRKNRKDGMLLRKIPSKIANRMIRRMTGVYIQDYGCTLKVFKSEVAKGLHLRGELHRFIPVLASFSGARITQVDVKHHPRQFGKSKYGINRTFKVISDLIMLLFVKKYSQKPMHFYGTMGVLSSIVGALIFLYLFILKIGFGQNIWGRPIMILGVIFFLAGIQLISIGILMEALLNSNMESNGKRTYSVRKVHTK